MIAIALPRAGIGTRTFSNLCWYCGESGIGKWQYRSNEQVLDDPAGAQGPPL